MSDTDSEEPSQHPGDRVAARKRYNMKALGQLVDSNRLTGVARPSEESSGPHHRDEDESDEPVGVVDVESPDEVVEVIEPSDLWSDDLNDDHGLGALFEEGDPVGQSVESGSEGLLDGTDGSILEEQEADSAPSTGEPADEPPPEGDLVVDDEPLAEEALDEDQDETLIELRERGARARRRPPRTFAGADPVTDDGIDRTELGTQVTRTGLGGLLEAVPTKPRKDPRESLQPLARQMLDEEIQPGGRLSNPRDVPGIVLNLAKDIPAAAAVSVVRIDEEIELVGNTIDPEVEPGVLASMFSGLFRSIQVAAGALAQGPLGKVHDLVIEGEHMDLILRPLGVHYYLMVLEDRRSDHADLAATRMRMAALAPGLSAILAQGDGEA